MTTRDRQFAMLVQTGAILQDLTSRIVGKSQEVLARVDALDALGLALEVPEYHVPVDVVSAARDYLDWAYGLSPMPEWFERWYELEPHRPLVRAASAGA
jgi:hypothetical protein